MEAIGSRSESGIATERRTGFVLDLNGADLSRTYLEKADLSNANLTFANLYHAVFYEWRRGYPPPHSPFYRRLRETNPDMDRSLLGNYANEKGWRRTYTANLFGADLSYANLSAARMEHVNLSGTQIREANLTGAWLSHANLRGANMFESDLSSHGRLHTDLSGADLSDASLAGCKCSGVMMTGTILCGTRFAGARLWATMLNSAKLTDNGQHPPVGLTQEQLDQTIVLAGNHPDLEGVVDAQTGEQLVWRSAIPHSEKLRRAGCWRRDSGEEDDEKDNEERGKSPPDSLN
jgi:uncharacterized protein YjbI with pentapeptide repeats